MDRKSHKQVSLCAMWNIKQTTFSPKVAGYCSGAPPVSCSRGHPKITSACRFWHRIRWIASDRGLQSRSTEQYLIQFDVWLHWPCETCAKLRVNIYDCISTPAIDPEQARGATMPAAAVWSVYWSRGADVHDKFQMRNMNIISTFYVFSYQIDLSTDHNPPVSIIR
jgi:hypothetical protein